MCAKVDIPDEIKVSSVAKLNEGGDLVCEYLGCSGDCDCDGDTGCPNPMNG